MTSNPAVGSSNISSFAWWEIATSTFNFAFIPVENSLIFLFSGRLYFLTCSKKKYLSNLWYKCSKTGTISRIVRYPLKPESDRTTPKASLSFAVKFSISFPRSVMAPPSIEINPKIALNVVLFPAPFCPISPVT